MNVTDLPEPVTRRIIVSDGDCWMWTGAIRRGYGRLWLGLGGNDGKFASTHRYTYELLVGPIPAGLDIDHLCRNQACCNPAHLEPVTRAENLRRKEEVLGIGRYATHCPRSHEYTAENTYWRFGRRSCRTCRLDVSRRYAKTAVKA